MALFQPLSERCNPAVSVWVKLFCPMRKLIFAFALAAVALMGACGHSAETPMTSDPLTPSSLAALLKPTHPRLLVGDGTWAQLKARRAADAGLDAFLERQEVEARALLPVEPIAYKMTGRRLLSVSRTVLRRVMLLSMQYQLTGDKELLERSQSEMLSAANFKNWNPSHFLDTAEMTAALAIGYDWLHDDLDAAARSTIARAIREKGLEPGLKIPRVFRTQSNWNSVCNAGMVLGALALAPDEPQMAAHYVNQAREFNPRALGTYAPDGIYPEGVGYWAYGTTFQVMLIGTLRSALGRDWGLSEFPGFLPSAQALFHLVGPSGAAFNFSDGSEHSGFDGTTLWFAKELNLPQIARLEDERLRAYQKQKPQPDSQRARTLPLAALWWPTANAKQGDWPLSWRGDGPNPVATFRSRWDDPTAMWLALKGGKATNPHGHMDAGSFVFEADGVRWASDLGAQDYNSLESKGVSLWDSKQSGQRWRVFRLGPFSHNTLTINGELHDARGEARITRFAAGSDAGAVVDLSPVFKGQAQRVTRGFSFRAGQDTTIRDEVAGLKAGDTVRFALLTKAQVALSDDGQCATLNSDGQILTVRLVSGAAKWEVLAAKGAQNYDADNPDARILVANFTAPQAGELSWAVTLTPGSAKAVAANALAQTAIKDWPLARVE